MMIWLRKRLTDEAGISGPPKQYTSALETRLFETENVLIALLSQVSDAQLTAGFHRLEALRRQDVGLPDDAGTLAYARKHKFGPSYWSDFPLRSAEDAKRWSEDRMLGAPDGGGTGSGPRVANTTTSPNQSLDVHFGYPGTQFEEQPDAGDQQEDYDEGMGMMEVVEEEQSSPADLRRSQGAVPGTGESPSTPQRRPDRDAGPGKHRAPSGSFDSAYIW